MATDKEIAEAAKAARDSLDPWQQVDAAKATVALLKVGVTKFETVELVPTIATFIKKGMAAQEAADTVIAEFKAKQKS